ncbi:hypothetical protein TrVE_jg14054 [Triparma verrucosa]|uniref:Cytochrome b5 heme-binding domain-containing protein n=1 Tax=Triparma verrucosa TaxID=1606542 RepID=A0A9W7C1W5_9STRA|nr:hypothetical protein TrVE_jg14054 [Triparma verrucosa]
MFSAAISYLRVTLREYRLSLIANCPVDVDVLKYTLLVVLTLITIYRKELSTNSRHRHRRRGYGKSSLKFKSAQSINVASSGGGEDEELQDGDNDDESLSVITTIIASKISSEVKEYYSKVHSKVHTMAATTASQMPQMPTASYDPLGDQPSPDTSLASTSSPPHHSNLNTINRLRLYSNSGELLGPLFPDTLILIFTYLSAKDLLTVMSSVSKGIETVVRSNEMWLSLFREHYGELGPWKVAKEAYTRSRGVGGLMSHRVKEGSDFKSFYLVFTCTWLNWCIAGHATDGSCLVGLHGSVYNLTNFLDDHPGSPESLLYRSGKDSTQFFEDIGHSINARQLALTMLEVPAPQGYGVNDLKRRRKPFRDNYAFESTTEVVSEFLRKGYERKSREVETWKSLLGKDDLEVNIFYDPVVEAWSVWFLSELGLPTFITGRLCT